MESKRFTLVASALVGLHVKLHVPNPGDYLPGDSFIEIEGHVEQSDGTTIKLTGGDHWVDLLQTRAIEIQGGLWEPETA